MGDGEAARIQFGEERLHVAQDGLAGCRIPDMADRRFARQAGHRRSFGKIIADKSEPALGIVALSVK